MRWFSSILDEDFFFRNDELKTNKVFIKTVKHAQIIRDYNTQSCNLPVFSPMDY